MGGNPIGAEMGREGCICNSKIQTTLLTPNYTIQGRVAGFAADTSMRKSRKGKEKRKARRLQASLTGPEKMAEQ